MMFLDRISIVDLVRSQPIDSFVKISPSIQLHIFPWGNLFVHCIFLEYFGILILGNIIP